MWNDNGVKCYLGSSRMQLQTKMKSTWKCVRFLAQLWVQYKLQKAQENVRNTQARIIKEKYSSSWLSSHSAYTCSIQTSIMPKMWPKKNVVLDSNAHLSGSLAVKNHYSYTIQHSNRGLQKSAIQHFSSTMPSGLFFLLQALTIPSTNVASSHFVIIVVTFCTHTHYNKQHTPCIFYGS